MFTVLWMACLDLGPGGGPDRPISIDCGDIDLARAQELNLQQQLVLNLSLAQGDNYDSVAEFGLPEPEFFRDFADDFAALDLGSIEVLFDPPAQVVADLRTTADLLEDALAAGADTADPAWAALSAFYTNEVFVSNGASISYYLGEAGCTD